MNKVAYVIVGWNNLGLLKECFDSINNQDYKEKVIVYVDNNSEDDSVQFVKENYPYTIILEPGTNTGFAKGNNIGIKQALSDNSVAYVVLLNSDARLEKNWTSRIVDFTKHKPKGAMFQGVTLDYYDHNVIDSTHIYVARNGQATQGGWRFYRKNEFGPKKVFGVNAAACLISRNFLEIQPFGSEVFDERMFMYLEDVDIAARITMMGWDNYNVPGAIAYHMGSASSGKNPGFSLYMTFRNNSAMIFKNFPVKIIIRLIPALIRSDIDTFRHLRKLGRGSAAWKVLKGRVVGLFFLPLYMRKRQKMKLYTAIDKEYLWYLMNRGY